MPASASTGRSLVAHDAKLRCEHLWQLDPTRIAEARRTLEMIGRQWEVALGKLRLFAESSCASQSHATTALHLFMPEAADEMIVDHTGRLHVRIDDGRADEIETALLHIAAEPIG